MAVGTTEELDVLAGNRVTETDDLLCDRDDVLELVVVERPLASPFSFTSLRCTSSKFDTLRAVRSGDVDCCSPFNFGLVISSISLSLPSVCKTPGICDTRGVRFEKDDEDRRSGVSCDGRRVLEEDELRRSPVKDRTEGDAADLERSTAGSWSETLSEASSNESYPQESVCKSYNVTMPPVAHPFAI